MFLSYLGLGVTARFSEMLLESLCKREAKKLKVKKWGKTDEIRLLTWLRFTSTRCHIHLSLSRRNPRIMPL
ncbi:hypothetical protein RMSM_06087 [Rhodopirellula maiorica SM1]|uniref:Uncharacterized protein n=1 Tax=Rhodopirellula maiorica SM1 TaxID=1265738 RepID=M5RD46_9BACT|nr:hypothetical protein RMSM_06087 [Rhodopirellula maiorica SM1]